MKGLESIFVKLGEELKAAREKHPGNEGLFEALGEEVGELGRAMFEGEEPKDIAREAIQVMCVCCRIVLEGTTLPSGGALMQAEMLEAISRKHLKKLGHPD